MKQISKGKLNEKIEKALNSVLPTHVERRL